MFLSYHQEIEKMEHRHIHPLNIVPSNLKWFLEQLPQTPAKFSDWENGMIILWHAASGSGVIIIDDPLCTGSKPGLLQSYRKDSKEKEGLVLWLVSGPNFVSGFRRPDCQKSRSPDENYCGFGILPSASRALLHSKHFKRSRS